MKKNLIFKTVLLSMVLMTFGLISCNSLNNKKQSNENSVKVEKPSMDIFTAVYMGNEKNVEQHIKYGTDLNSHDAYGSTPLNIAITFFKTDIAKLLIDSGADINAKNMDGTTPLHTAAFFCRTEIVEYLLEKGVDTSVKNQYGKTALESVSNDFSEVKPIYIQINKDLGPLGLRLDLERIEATRPVIASMISK